MDKIIRLGTQLEYVSHVDAERSANVFCKIKFKDKRLSITGVVGPTSNGDAHGSCGQIYDSVNLNSYAEGWDSAKVSKFLAIWREWHLNDMNAASVEMKEAGWIELAKKPIHKYSFIRTKAYQKEFEALEGEIISSATKLNARHRPLEQRERQLLKSKRFIGKFGYRPLKPPKFMEPHVDYRTKHPKIESTTLGWVTPDQHPDGLLTRKLNPDDVYGYGQTWFFHEVPKDVIKFLTELPETDKQPAWI